MNSNTPQGGTGPNGPEMTEEQIKQAVLAMVDRGDKCREIAKVEFRTNGKVVRKSISQIATYVKERNQPQKQEDGNLAAAVCELFENKKGPVDAVVEMHIPPERATALYQSWTEMKRLESNENPNPNELQELRQKIEDICETLALYGQQYRQGFYDQSSDDETPDATDVLHVIAHAKEIAKLLNLGISATCGGCGAAGKFALRVFCTDCGKEHSLRLNQ